VFIIGNKDDFSLIDSGLFFKTKKLINELKANEFDLARLMNYNFKIALFSHGEPILNNANQILRDYFKY